MLGFYVQPLVTKAGPLANLQFHLADPSNNNIFSFTSGFAMFAASGRKSAPKSDNLSQWYGPAQAGMKKGFSFFSWSSKMELNPPLNLFFAKHPGCNFECLPQTKWCVFLVLVTW